MTLIEFSVSNYGLTISNRKKKSFQGRVLKWCSQRHAFLVPTFHPGRDQAASKATGTFNLCCSLVFRSDPASFILRWKINSKGNVPAEWAGQGGARFIFRREAIRVPNGLVTFQACFLLDYIVSLWILQNLSGVFFLLSLEYLQLI